jgi:hypothetical protein
VYIVTLAVFNGSITAIDDVTVTVSA